MITVLAGGVGAAKFLRGLVDIVDPGSITIIGNTADDEVFYGLHVSPDLDTIVYTLADVVNPETGWGLANDTYRTLEHLRALGEDTWFLLGDADIATHMKRTRLLRSGRSLTEATAEIARSFGLESRLLPMSDDRVRTVVTTDSSDLSFQEYFVRRGQQDEVGSIRFDGADIASPACGVVEAIQDADAVIVAPSNPLVSIGPVLAVPGLRDELVEAEAPVIGISPIVGGQALKGPADRMMRSLGHESSALGVARLYADFLDVLVLDNIDAALAPEIDALGIRPVATDTIMRDADSRRALAQATLDAARLIA
jgi:LPPG:FO 2-phospho-L-lactate transferase